MGDSLFGLVTDQLLLSEDLNQQQLETVLGTTLVNQVDYSDLFVQSLAQEHWYLEDSLVKEGGYSLDKGFGLRVISGETSGFAYSDDVSLLSLQNAAKSAKSIIHGAESKAIKTSGYIDRKPLYTTENPIVSVNDNEKVALLKMIDTKARAKDTRVAQVIASLSASYSVILLLNSFGEWVADKRPMVSLSIKVIVDDHGKRESGSASGGGRFDLQQLLNDDVVVDGYIDKAVNQALTNLSAVTAPAGTMPVVLGPGWPAIILHEAVGHGLEADGNRKGSSAFSSLMGERVASDLCSVVDDGTIAHRRGSLTVDDEGVPSQYTMLIEKGILKNYMYDRNNARLMGKESTGNGRRESYDAIPIPRMTNTYMLPGDSDPGDIIASIDKGIYAVDFSGGQVDTTSGKFVFSTSEAYLVEGGVIKHPVKSVSLIGSGPEVLMDVSMVGNDFELDAGLGTCGKQGQSVPVGVGQPTIKVDRITVGGSEG